jgi:hypothetical protein
MKRFRVLCFSSSTRMQDVVIDGADQMIPTSGLAFGKRMDYIGVLHAPPQAFVSNRNNKLHLHLADCTFESADTTNDPRVFQDDIMSKSIRALPRGKNQYVVFWKQKHEGFFGKQTLYVRFHLVLEKHM